MDPKTLTSASRLVVCLQMSPLITRRSKVTIYKLLKYYLSFIKINTIEIMITNKIVN